MLTILFLVCIFISCVLQGMTGFGFALLAAPLGLLFYDQHTMVVVLTLISLVLNLFLYKKVKSQIHTALTGTLLITGFVGVLIGVTALVTIDANILKLSAGVLAFMFTLILFSPKIKFKQQNLLTVIVGLITGFLQSSISLSGAPLVLILTGYGLDTKEIRKTLAFVFLFLSVFCLPLFLWKNILTWDRFLLSLTSIPVAIIGGVVGNKISDSVSKRAFRILSLAIVFVTSFQIVLKVLSEWRTL